ncbi:hypothetical protein BU15DRAFT_18723, partial [Melanogaster broomeanus]
GSQKYNTFHLCKHLVQAVSTPPPSFFGQVVRRRTSPLYRHPALQVPVPAHSHSGPADSIDRGGSITDGDDHLWTGDQTVL